jgi:cobalamin synthase
MAGWAGWGAGPAGAGSAGGPSRWFLVVLLLASAATAVALVRDRHWVEGGVAAAAAVYFGLRASGRLGGRRGDRQ